jgi:hypothetical protein
MINTTKPQLSHFFKNTFSKASIANSTFSSAFKQFKYFLALSLLITFSFNAFSERVFKNSDEIFLQPKMHGLNAKT